MKNRTYILISLIIAVFFYQTQVHAEEPALELPEVSISETVTIDATADLKPEGVTLEHKKHVVEYNLVCTDCHHMFDEKKAERPKPCIECHDRNEQKFIEKRRAPLIKTSAMKNIYHDQCKKCHEKLQRKGKPFPKKCATCHPVYEE